MSVPPFVRAAIVSISVLTACGGKETPPDTAANAETTSTASAEAPAGASATPAAKAEAVPAMVTTCEKSGDLCLPPPKFVKKMCANVNPELALVYFKKGSPFTRAYLTGSTDAVNASGGASSQDKFVFDEEVIILIERKNNTGIEVSGAGTGYDVLRWDGSCASLSGPEITFKAPPTPPKAARVEWKMYSEEVQNALLGDANIAKINKTRRDECKGVSMGDVSKACQVAVDKLSLAIPTYIRGGGEVPVPKALK